MAELTPQERLQPSLLDRLTDDAPHERQESRDQRVLSVKRLREVVLRDLAWLLNSTNLTPVHDLSEYPQVASSVLNYGVPDLTGRTVAGLNAARLERTIRQAIWDFEPRILRDTVRVHVRKAEDQMSRSALAFEIEGELWAQPVPLRLYLRTDVDLDTGDILVQEGFAKTA